MKLRLIVLMIVLLMLAGCADQKAQTDGSGDQKAENSKDAANGEGPSDAGAEKEEDKGEKEMSFTQLDAPKPGEELAVFHTSMGDIKFRLFPEAAPKAVENFKKHIKDGYYNGIIFHRVIKDFMIQGGDPTGTGMGGESVWGEAFEDEFSPYFRNIKGALSMANAGPNTNGSQFFIVHEPKVDENILTQMEKAGEQDYPKEVIAAYKEHGGAFWLDFKHTVFGQVCEGYEVVDAIAKVETGESDKPLKDVVIESAEIIVAK